MDRNLDDYEKQLADWIAQLSGLVLAAAVLLWLITALLCLHRGAEGSTMELLLDAGGLYAGQPLLITGNDYDLGVFNGDIGVVVVSDGGL